MRVNVFEEGSEENVIWYKVSFLYIYIYDDNNIKKNCTIFFFIIGNLLKKQCTHLLPFFCRKGSLKMMRLLKTLL